MDRTPWQPTSSGYKLNDIKNIKTPRIYGERQEEETADNNDLIITSLHAASQPMKSASYRKKQLDIKKRKDGAAPSNTGDMNIESMDSQVSCASSSGNTTITFTNTAAFGRLQGQGPDRWENRGQEDDPKCPKYSKGYGSVKGLHYRKYIGLEMLSENNFALTFHKFYSNEIKNLIRSMNNSRFSPEMRTWILSIFNYDQLMSELK